MISKIIFRSFSENLRIQNTESVPIMDLDFLNESESCCFLAFYSEERFLTDKPGDAIFYELNFDQMVSPRYLEDIKYTNGNKINVRLKTMPYFLPLKMCNSSNTNSGPSSTSISYIDRRSDKTSSPQSSYFLFFVNGQPFCAHNLHRRSTCEPHHFELSDLIVPSAKNLKTLFFVNGRCAFNDLVYEFSASSRFTAFFAYLEATFEIGMYLHATKQLVFGDILNRYSQGACQIRIYDDSMQEVTRFYFSLKKPKIVTSTILGEQDGLYLMQEEDTHRSLFCLEVFKEFTFDQNFLVRLHFLQAATVYHYEFFHNEQPLKKFEVVLETSRMFDNVSSKIKLDQMKYPEALILKTQETRFSKLLQMRKLLLFLETDASPKPWREWRGIRVCPSLLKVQFLLPLCSISMKIQEKYNLLASLLLLEYLEKTS